MKLETALELLQRLQELREWAYSDKGGDLPFTDPLIKKVDATLSKATQEVLSSDFTNKEK